MRHKVITNKLLSKLEKKASSENICLEIDRDSIACSVESNPYLFDISYMKGEYIVIRAKESEKCFKSKEYIDACFERLLPGNRKEEVKEMLHSI